MREENVFAIIVTTAFVLVIGIVAMSCVVTSRRNAEHEEKMAELGYMQVLQDGNKLWVPAIAPAKEGEAK